ncbi:MAG: zf-HC2 domain-containing protein [Planctomycetes bacterium]|nr:zf-HC2 domain-containing protein [Planctomycetota bacterium]
MRCEQSERWISLAADQELSVVEVGLLREHLAACPACNALAEESRDLHRWFVAPPEVQIPAGFAQRVAAAAFDGAPQAVKGPRGVVRGEDSAVVGSSDRNLQGFLFQLTALAALLLVALAFALAGKKAAQSRDLHAVDTSMDKVIEQLDQLNTQEFDGAAQTAPKETGE